MDEASFFDRWYLVEQYAVQQICVVPPREGEKWNRGGREGGIHGCRFQPDGHAFFVYFFHGCCSRLGASEL
jgi:hypothetical protein